MMAAIRAGQLHQQVVLLEKNAGLGRKLLLSGKGRCNLTNACSLDEFLGHFSKNGQFLRDAFKKFFNQDLMNFFEERGLPVKVERQMRVFPVSDRSASILDVLEKELIKNNVEIIFKAKIKSLSAVDNKVKGLYLADGQFLPADKIILATGGVSFSLTGSTGDGFEFSRKLGHTVTAFSPGLVPLKTADKFVKNLEGLTLKNVLIRFCDGKREIVSDVGELLFTFFGISGPLVLALSGKVVNWLKENKKVHVEIDLKPGLSEEQLNNRLLREFSSNPRKNIKNVLKGFLPLRMVDVFLEIAKINPEIRVNQISRQAREGITNHLKAFRLDIAGSLPIEEAMVTQGGVFLKEIDPRTMESRKIDGLYFAGEMIDVDADTGGFNLQAAFSTGYLAGESAALS